MSWGYFGDLKLALDEAAWKRLLSMTPGEVELDASWAGLSDASLAAGFYDRTLRENGETFAAIVEWPIYRRESIHHIAAQGGRVELRIAVLFDKSQLEMASYLAALFEGARALGAEGSFALVNDGTYSGESGVLHTIAGGEWTSEPLEDSWPLVETLTAALYGAELVGELDGTPPEKSAIILR
jgi:hypothetical protein